MAKKNIAGITAKLGLDVSGVTSALKEIEKKSKSLASEMKAVDDALKFNPDSIVLAAQKQELLSEAISNTEKKLAELESVQKKTDNAFKNQAKWEEQYAPLKEALDSTKEKLRDLQKQNEKMKSDFESGKINSEQYDAYQKELEATQNKMKDLQKQNKELEASFEDGHISADEYRAYQREVENTKRQLQDLKSKQSDAGKSTEDLGKTVEKSGDNFKNAKKDIKDYKDAVSDLKSAMKDVTDDLKGLATLAGGAVTAVGTAAVGAVGSAVEVGASFEKSMSKVEAISGATGEDLERLKNAAKEMGASTSKTASESADALSYMALAGWKTEDMLTGLEPILRASEAGEMDLATCSDLVTDSMSAMGVETKDLAHYLDVVAAAQSNSNTDMQQLLEAFVECGGSAHNFGLNVEDLSTVLGVMANRGVKGTEAGTALNSIFVNMLGSTKRTAEAMDTLGLSLYDENGKMKDMTEVLKEMGGALESATDEQRNNLEAMLGGKTQITALQAMVNGLNGEYDALSETLYNCDGALLKTAQTMQDNLTGDMTILSSGLEALGNEVYEYLEEPLRSAVQTATGEISKLTKSVTEGQLSETVSRLADSFGKLIEKTAKFAADKGIPALINTLDWISQNGDKIISTVEGMGAAWATWKIATMVGHVQNLVKAIKDFKIAQEAATAAQIAANKAAMANVYAAVAAAVVGLTAAVVSFVKGKYDELQASREAEAAYSKETEALINQADALKESTEEAEKHIKTIDHNADVTQSLWNEIQLLVDEEGRAIGSTEGLESAVSRLNAISDENIEIVGNQIVGYKDLKDSMEDVIETQRKQAKLEYLHSDYVDAIYNVDAMKKQQDEVIKQRDEFQRKLDEANEKGKRAVEAYQAYLDDNLNFDPKEWGFKDIDEIDAARYLDTLDLELKIKDLDAQEKSLEGIIAAYNSTITEYRNIENGYKEMSQDEAIRYGYEQEAKKLEEINRQSANAVEEAGTNIGTATIEGIEQGIRDGMEDSDLRKLVNQYISDLKYEQAKLGKDDAWLYDEEEKMLSVFGEGSEIYREFMTTVLNGRKKLSESEAKANKTTKSDAKEAAEKEAQAILDEMDKMYDSAIADGSEVGEAAAKSIAYGVEKGLDDNKLKSAVDKYLKKADIEKALNHKDDDGWYYDQLEQMTNSLTKGTDLYDTFFLQLVEGRNKVADNDEKANKKETDSAKKKAEEVEKLQEKYQADFGSVFTRNTSNGKNGNKGNRHIDTEKIEKIVAAKEKLSGYLTQLAEKGMPQSVIDELLSLDPLEAVEYARMLLKNPSKFDSIKNLAERDQAAAKKLAEASVASEDALKEAGEKGGNTYASGFINAVGTAISAALPNLSGIGIAVNNAEQSKQKAEQNKQDNYTAQTVEAMNVAQTTALLEGIASMLNTAIGEKGITISFNPTIETSVNMDGETVAKNVTKKQTEHTVRTNG